VRDPDVDAKFEDCAAFGLGCGGCIIALAILALAFVGVMHVAGGFT
jgi:hypothetical protein